MTTQQEACKEAIDKLLTKVDKQNKVIKKLVCYLYTELGGKAVDEILTALDELDG